MTLCKKTHMKGSKLSVTLFNKTQWCVERNLPLVNPSNKVQGRQRNCLPAAPLGPQPLPSVSLTGSSLKTSSNSDLTFGNYGLCSENNVDVAQNRYPQPRSEKAANAQIVQKWSQTPNSSERPVFFLRVIFFLRDIQMNRQCYMKSFSSGNSSN